MASVLPHLLFHQEVTFLLSVSVILSVNITAQKVKTELWWNFGGVEWGHVSFASTKLFKVSFIGQNLTKSLMET